MAHICLERKKMLCEKCCQVGNPSDYSLDSICHVYMTREQMEEYRMNNPTYVFCLYAKNVHHFISMERKIQDHFVHSSSFIPSCNKQTHIAPGTWFDPKFDIISHDNRVSTSQVHHPSVSAGNMLRQVARDIDLIYSRCAWSLLCTRKRRHGIFCDVCTSFTAKGQCG